MARNPRKIDADLDALYAELPQIECRGRCSDSCGPVQMSVRERARIESQHGEVSCGFGPTCTMLDGERRCRAYTHRPMICRLWGIVESMPCHFGCKPERYLTDDEGREFLARALAIGGRPPDLDAKVQRDLERQIRVLEAATRSHNNRTGVKP